MVLAVLFCLLAFAPFQAIAAPYAAFVIDARDGKVLHARNADTRLHPASLTKMMTLYIAFEAIKHGEISLDTKVKISKNAAAEPSSKLGLKAGQRIKLRYLIRATAVKSANDAATAIGEAIAGSEAAFARRMNRTAKALGMTRTTFKNMSGLTQAGHLSTARDMTKLGRHLFYDHPEYYNLFSRKTVDAGVKTVTHTNSRFLNSYRGADGIKTGYTRAAGFNLVASARRGNERIIVTVFGGRSVASRNAQVTKLMDLGFRRAPSRVRIRKPGKPRYNRPGPKSSPPETVAVASAQKPKFVPGTAGKTIRLQRAVKASPRPAPRPLADPPAELLVAMKSDIETAVELAEQSIKSEQASTPTAVSVAPVAVATAPAPRPAVLTTTAITSSPAAAQEPVVVTRLSTSGGRLWGVNVGSYASHHQAERVLLKTALTEMTTLDGALRKVVRRKTGFDANFVGMTKQTAALACRRLQARNITCKPLGPI
ncbi:MAG: D-alanyl-D-alanine carboxypeptidase [Rhodobacterales bacterium]|nr:MAG: D-alanyl-D-alanine carboxypeptidase [Rhodobacterales bacterium]